MTLPPLTAEAIAPFATLLKAKDGKFTDIPAVLEIGDTPGHHGFAILCPQPVASGKVSITSLERHPHSTQSFIPIAGRPLDRAARSHSARRLARCGQCPRLHRRPRATPSASIAMSGTPA